MLIYIYIYIACNLVYSLVITNNPFAIFTRNIYVVDVTKEVNVGLSYAKVMLIHEWVCVWRKVFLLRGTNVGNNCITSCNVPSIYAITIELWTYNMFKQRLFVSYTKSYLLCVIYFLYLIAHYIFLLHQNFVWRLNIILCYREITRRKKERKRPPN